MTQEELQAMRDMLKAKREAAKEGLAVKAEVAQINAEMKLLDNPALEAARVAAEVKRLNNEKLSSLIKQCEIIVKDTPVYDDRRKANREFRTARYFGLGDQIDKLYGLLTGVQYSVAEHKEEMLAVTNLNEETIESAIEAFGQPASYYNEVMREEIPTTAKDLREALALVAEEIGIIVDINKITDSKVDAMFTAARAKANRELAEYELTKELENQTIDI